MARLGTIANAALTLALSGCATLLGTYEFETLEARSAVAPLPAAPPPAMPGPHWIDLSLRELGATRGSASELAGHRETGLHPLRTDGAISVRVHRYVMIRAVGALAYGSPIGTPSAPGFPSRASLSAGLAVGFGYWEDPLWSVSLEVVGGLVALDNREQWQGAIGPCYSVPGLFGSTMSCVPERYTGLRPVYEGMHLAPTPGGTLDVALQPVPWLRIGVGGGALTHVSRGLGGDVRYEPLGLARLFLDAWIEDVRIGVEAQQWIVEGVSFAPALGITVGGALAPRAPRHRVDDAEEPSPVPTEPLAAEPSPSIPWLPGVAP